MAAAAAAAAAVQVHRKLIFLGGRIQSLLQSLSNAIDTHPYDSPEYFFCRTRLPVSLSKVAMWVGQNAAAERGWLESN